MKKKQTNKLCSCYLKLPECRYEHCYFLIALLVTSQLQPLRTYFFLQEDNIAQHLMFVQFNFCGFAVFLSEPVKCSVKLFKLYLFIMHSMIIGEALNYHYTHIQEGE